MAKEYLLVFIITLFYSNLGYCQQSKHGNIEINDDSLVFMLKHIDQFDEPQLGKKLMNWARDESMKGIEHGYVAYDSMLSIANRNNFEKIKSEAYYGLGSLANMKSDYQNSKEYMQKCISFPPISKSTRMVHFFQLADVYGVLGMLDSSYFYFDTLFSEKDFLIEEGLIAEIYINYGKLLIKDKRLNSAIIEFEKALEMKDEHLSPLAVMHVNCFIAQVYIDILDYKNALLYYKKAEEIALKNNYKVSLGRVYFGMGEFNQMINDYDKAIFYYKKGLEAVKGKGYENLVFLIHTSISRSYLSLGDIQNAKLQYNLIANRYDESYGYKANVHYQILEGELQLEGKNSIALVHFENALDKAKHNNDWHLTNAALMHIKSYYVKNGNLKKALAYTDSIKIVKDEAQKEANLNYIYDFETKYNKAKQDEEILRIKSDQAITKLRLEKKNNQLILSILGLAIAMLLGGALYYFYKLKSKMNIELGDKNNKLKQALTTNKMLVKEIHHRVKNNLQVVSSLLNLQSNYTKDDKILQALNTGRNRVQSMALLHQNLYGNENLKQIYIKKYFEDLVDGLVLEYPFKEDQEIKAIVNVQDLVMDIDVLVPLGLIVNELITNALKYAYNEQAEYILGLEIKMKGKSLHVEVRDNGAGLPFDKLPEKTTSLGTRLISSFLAKLDGEIKISNVNGAKVSISIPIAESEVKSIT